MKEIISNEDHFTNYNIVNVCKQKIVNGYKSLQNYNEADWPGYFCFNWLK